jgi:hypothetical protein
LKRRAFVRRAVIETRQKMAMKINHCRWNTRSKNQRPTIQPPTIERPTCLLGLTPVRPGAGGSRRRPPDGADPFSRANHYQSLAFKAPRGAT